MFKRLRRWERGSIHQIRARRACLPLGTPAAARHPYPAGRLPPKDLEEPSQMSLRAGSRR
jgi:hypothetical protein